MARIAGVNIPDNKHIVISLRYVYGIGLTQAKIICDATGIEPSTKVSDLSPEQLDGIRAEVAKVPTEGDLRREISMNIKRLMDLGCNRGIRHRRSLPVRGQRTKTNARIVRVLANRLGSNKWPLPKQQRRRAVLSLTVSHLFMLHLITPLSRSLIVKVML